MFRKLTEVQILRSWRRLALCFIVLYAEYLRHSKHDFERSDVASVLQPRLSTLAIALNGGLGITVLRRAEV
jgi:hypothetical protein